MFAQSDVAGKWLVGPIVVLGFQRTADARGIAFSARLMGSARGAEGYDRRLTPILFLTTQVPGRECIHD
jgi:hypothetical protein